MIVPDESGCRMALPIVGRYAFRSGWVCCCQAMMPLNLTRAVSDRDPSEDRRRRNGIVLALQEFQ
jgi:hypothetical protein